MHNEYRIGQGYDVHRLVEGRPLILGGVTIKHDKGLYGHSDADALFGAAALGDIGRHFPDTDPKYKGADSALLLSEALELVLKRGWMPVNADCTIIAQKPKLAPYMEQINASLASILRLPIDCVNVKAKTNELLGFEGREEGIVAQAVILLKARS